MKTTCLTPVTSSLTRHGRWPGARHGLLALLLLALTPPAAYAQESLCARVKIEIEQELTLERQAFDARMKITNGTTFSMTDVRIDVSFATEDGTVVTGTSDPENTQALFYIRVDKMEGIADVAGAGTVNGSTAATIHWLIIPAPGAGGEDPRGAMYYVGAKLTYKLGGEENTTEVTPDYIFVKPMPKLTLDYFLPSEVYGDDPFTLETEPEQPFGLGVRISNHGFGPAAKLKIDSGQPKIVDNKLGLLVSFKIHGCEVGEKAATNSLLADFGDILPSRYGVARWSMTSSLSGQFIEFTATFTHADELGGELTSLMDAVNTHLLVRDVRVDLNGRDHVRDFLAKDGDVLKVYESEGQDTAVTDQSAQSTLVAARGVEYTLTTPLNANGFVFAKLADPQNGDMVIDLVTREDGKVIKPENAWLSQTWDNPNRRWIPYLNLFDFHASEGRGGRSDINYTVKFAARVDNQPPVLTPIGNKSELAGNPVTITVSATDPNGTQPALTMDSLPGGASFTDHNDGTGTFSWTPPASQVGFYELTFNASDGELTDSETIVLAVNGPTPTVAFAAASSLVAEDAGSASVTVVLTNFSTTACSVDFASPGDGTAAHGSDYVLTGGTVQFPPMTREQAITVTITDDRNYEPTAETVNITLSNAVQANLGTPATHTLTITDNETLWPLVLTLKPGWNMIALPGKPNSVLVPGKAGPQALGEFLKLVAGGVVWQWHVNNYVTTRNVNGLRGYWVFRAGTQIQVTFNCEPSTNLTLKKGWNFIGVGSTQPLPVTQLPGGNDGIVRPVWGWRGGAQTDLIPYTSTLPAGEAFWIFLRGNQANVEW